MEPSQLLIPCCIKRPTSHATGGAGGYRECARGSADSGSIRKSSHIRLPGRGRSSEHLKFWIGEGDYVYRQICPLLNHSSSQFNPKLYTFDQHPHHPGASLCVTTLPSVSSSDSGIQFVTADSLGEMFRWSYNGSAISVNPVKHPGLNSLPSTHRHSFTGLMWAAERQKLWLGTSVNEDPSGSLIGVLSEWDISTGTGDPTGSRKVHAPVIHVHQSSANVALAEVCSISFPLTLL
jgi:hypothetical protein